MNIWGQGERLLGMASTAMCKLRMVPPPQLSIAVFPRIVGCLDRKDRLGEWEFARLVDLKCE